MVETKLCGAEFVGADSGVHEDRARRPASGLSEAPMIVEATDAEGASSSRREEDAFLRWQLRWHGHFADADDMNAAVADNVTQGGGHRLNVGSGLADWRTHVKRLLGAKGEFDDGCGRLPSEVARKVAETSSTAVTK